MVKLYDMYQQLNDLLPEGQKADSLTVFPLPYDGYFEIFVETKSKKRYRALATMQQTISNFTEMSFPAQAPQVVSKGVK